MEDSLLLVFVKNPVPGKVKTRLAATLGNDKALEIYKRLLTYTRDICLKVEVDKEIWYGNEIPEKDIWSEARLNRFPQAELDLGGRMAAAFGNAYQKGYKKVVIIGSDNAKLTDKHIQQAFSALETNDVVIGPALDGGYYLLGLGNTPHYPILFSNKKWSSETVFSDTMGDIKKLGLSVQLLESLSDIDYEEDLKGTFLQSYLTD